MTTALTPATRGVTLVGMQTVARAAGSAWPAAAPAAKAPVAGEVR